MSQIIFLHGASSSDKTTLARALQREAERGNRQIGSATKDQETIHQGRVYDLEVNSPDGVEVNATLILDALYNGLRRSEFTLRG
ncbi:hypothetical protein [uncultured Ruegeria sp.]|uniref:phosphotransferase-like protein n=1 Tax=uncultured Ruegeria sp. TaxID=259304 RepID=UPI00262CFB03|nr:hypothetical protein [uncultured Ruegeria sp.]